MLLSSVALTAISKNDYVEIYKIVLSHWSIILYLIDPQSCLELCSNVYCIRPEQIWGTYVAIYSSHCNSKFRSNIWYFDQMNQTNCSPLLRSQISKCTITVLHARAALWALCRMHLRYCQILQVTAVLRYRIKVYWTQALMCRHWVHQLCARGMSARCTYCCCLGCFGLEWLFTTSPRREFYKLI